MAITVTGGPAYGASWIKASSPALTRQASAAGLTAGSAFDSLAGGAWGLRRCNLWDDGTTTAYYGDRCYTDTDVVNMGQVMVKIPKFYYYMEYDAGTTTYYWFVTTNASTTVDVGLGVGAQAVKIHPAFTRDAATRENIYVGAYEGYKNTITNKLESLAGVQPTPGYTRGNYRTWAREHAGAAESVKNKWEQQDYLTHSALQLLYLIEYATFYAQSTALGAGVSNLTGAGGANNSCKTGHTTSLGNGSGSVAFAADNGYETTATQAMSYRGIENWYGNTREWIDGINIGPPAASVNYGVYVADHDFASSTSAHPYVDTTIVLPNSDGSISNIGTTATYDYGFLPSAFAGGTSTYLCALYYHNEGDMTAYISNWWGSGAAASPFYLNITYAPAIGAPTVGSRLAYIG